MPLNRKLILSLIFAIALVDLPGYSFDLPYSQKDSIDILLKSAQKNTYKKPELAEEEARLAYKGAVEGQERVRQGEALRIIGGSFFVRGDYDLALDNFLAARQLFEQEGDTAKLCRIMSNIGLVYKSLKSFDTSLRYYGLALDLSRVEDSVARSKIYNNIGVVYKHLQKYDTAFSYFERSLKLKQALNDDKGQANTLTNLGNIAGLQGDNLKALKLFRQSLNLEKNLGHEEGVAKNVNNMARAHFRLSGYDSAIYYSKIGLEIAQKLKTKIQISEAAETLAKGYDKKRNYRLAYTFHTLHSQMKDSLMNEDLSRRIGQLESKLALEQKDKEIKTLTLEKQLNSTQLSEARLQITILVMSIIFLIAMGVVLFVFYQKKQKNDRLTQQLQFDALQIRYLELLQGPTTFDLTLSLEALNKKLFNPLTDREYEILQLSLKGLTNKQIADKIFVSLSTVKFHLGNIYNKFGVTNKKEALEYVVKTS